MARVTQVPKRADVPAEHTWDLRPLFGSDREWEKAFERLEKRIPDFERYRGKLGDSPRTLREFLDFQVEFEKESERLGEYAHLKQSEDVANSTYQGMLTRFIHVATRAGEAASFVAPEIHAIPDDKMKRFLAHDDLAPFRFQLEKLLRYKPHILSEAEERLLAMQGEISDAAGRIFGQLNDADLKFGYVVDEHGRKIELTQSSYRSLIESPRRSVRREAFTKMHAQYEAHANTLAATYHASVLQDIYHARVRKFPSAREAALFGEKIPVAVYDRLIEAVRADLKTVYRYFELRRNALRLKTIHAYDTYAPIVHMAPIITPYEKATETIVKALEPLGDEYCGTLRDGLLEKRWVDRYENGGKRSGAFSSGGYSSPPYILMNYRDDVLDSMFTLAHEAGHSMHTYYSARNQPFQDYQYSLFVAEVASTFNEQLLNEFVLKQAKDRKMRAYLISREIDEIRGTLVRQTMFAEFEKIVHELVERDEPLTLDRIKSEYRALLEAYFGPDFRLDDALTFESLRIPHFYRAFYVYKYATGISAAITLAEKVLHGGEKERQAYLAFLKLGGSKFPLDALRVAGVDMEKPEPVASAMRRFARLVNELSELI